MRFFSKAGSSRSAYSQQQEQIGELLEKAAINERFRKLIMIDPESALKIYPLSNYEFDTVIVGTSLMQHIIQIAEGKKEESDDTVYVLDEHLKSVKELDIEEIKMSVSPKVERILDELQNIVRMLKDLDAVTFSFYDDERTLFQKKGKLFLSIRNLKCNHDQEFLTQEKKRDMLLVLNDIYSVIPVIKEIRQRGTCETCGCKLDKLEIVVISEAKMNNTLRSR